MSFKENLKNKLLIAKLSALVSRSTGSPGTGRKVDKQAMRRLLELSPFVLEKHRDLELYARQLDEGPTQILVLDNELPLYANTSVEDVTLRRSPELKEMISIRNIIKILNDSDILLHKGRESVDYVRDRALELLDLRYDRKDIEDMANDGMRALAAEDPARVEETLGLFVELLGYKPLPAQAMANDYVMFGACQGPGSKEESFGPVVMYNDETNVLRLINQKIPMGDPGSKDTIPGVATGHIEPDAQEFEVFDFLKEEVLKKPGPTVH